MPAPAELGIADDVIVSGFVASDHEVFGLFSEIDAFCYPLDEGLTARRSSILTCVQSGRPLIVAGPVPAGGIRPSSAFQGIDRPRRHRAGARAARTTRPMPTGSSSAVKRPPVHLPFDFDGWWKDVAEAVRPSFPARAERANPV